MPKIAFLFPGQGSQEVGMGRAFHDSDPELAAVFEQAEKVTGMPIRSLCFEGPMDKLTQTANLQPALTTVCMAGVAALRAAGITPDAVAGHSVGEYSALAAAGVIDASRAIALTTMRGDYMERDANRNPGTMAAVMGWEIGRLTQALKDSGHADQVQVANHNAANQAVLTGEKEGVEKFSAEIKAQGAKVIPLKVSGAWHSKLMSAAANDFAIRLAQTQWLDARVPVYLNVTGQPATVGMKIGETMSLQLTAPVRWHDIMVNMLAEGCDTFVEVGPKNVLAGLMRKHAADRPGVRVFNVDGPDGVAALKAAL